MWTYRNYDIQYSYDVTHKAIKMSCDTTQFPVMPFCGPHVKSYGVWGLSRHYHLQLDPKLGHGKCAVQKVPWACVSNNNMLAKHRGPGVSHVQQPQ